MASGTGILFLRKTVQFFATFFKNVKQMMTVELSWSSVIQTAQFHTIQV